jgi:uncharacterized protein (TIGR02328 family)
MRLWHKYLIGVLPRKQLLGQWRECCLIAKSIAEKGTPNHLLVNKVMEYPISEFCDYCNIVLKQMVVRGYNVSGMSILCLEDNVGFCVDSDLNMGIFKGWHNDRYLAQCFYNLQEKYDCGGISEDEWVRVQNRYEELMK